MSFICCIIGVLIFAKLFEKLIKRYEWCFYMVCTALVLVDVGVYVLEQNGYVITFSIGLSTFMALVHQGVLATAFFAWVMLAGALNMQWQVSRLLKKLRGELSIIGSILVSSHALCYGYDFLAHLGRLGRINGWALWTTLVVFLCGAYAFGIMCPLWITSYKSIRRKLRGKRWIQLQQYAYIFYAMVYFHILAYYLGKPDLQEEILSLMAYSVIFVIYAFLRVDKALKKRGRGWLFFIRKEVVCEK